MTENYYAIAGVLEAIKNKFGQQGGETPARMITPAEFREVCVAHGVEAATAYDMATFAVSLVRGMLTTPATIPAIVGAADGGAMGGELIVQVETLKSIM